MSQTKGIEMNQDKKYITKPIVEVVLNTLQVKQLFYGESMTHNKNDSFYHFQIF